MRVEHPSRELAVIQERLDQVQILVKSEQLCARLARILQTCCHDLTRILQRILIGCTQKISSRRDHVVPFTVSPRDLRQCALTLQQAVLLQKALCEFFERDKGQPSEDGEYRAFSSTIRDLGSGADAALAGEILAAIVETDIPARIGSLGSEGSAPVPVIAPGFNPELDSARALALNISSEFERLLEEIRRDLGNFPSYIVGTERVRLVQVSGEYFFRITRRDRTVLDKAPGIWIENEADSGEIRFTTQALCRLNSSRKNATSNAIALEQSLFNTLSLKVPIMYSHPCI